MEYEIKFAAAFSFVAPDATVVEAGDFLKVVEKQIDGTRMGEYLIYAESEEPIIWTASARDILILSGHTVSL